MSFSFTINSSYNIIFASTTVLFSTHSFSSVQFSRSVVSDSLRPHEPQQARPPCPSPTPGVHWDSGPSSQWCHPAILSSVVPFSSCLQSLPASESFPVSQLFAWGGQSIGVSASASFLPKKSQGWAPSEVTRKSGYSYYVSFLISQHWSCLWSIWMSDIGFIHSFIYKPIYFLMHKVLSVFYKPSSLF